MNNRKPTIREIAARAGVSPAAVSYALRGLGNLSSETRQRVLEAATALGYPVSHRPQPEPRALNIGIIYPAQFDEGVMRSGEIYSHYARGIREVLSSMPGSIVTYVPNAPDGFAFCHLLEEGVPGLLFFGVDQHDPAVQIALAQRMPIVLLNHHGGPGVSSVCVAHRQAMQDMITHLTERHDCRRFLFMQPLNAASYSHERLAGCREGLQRCGLSAQALTVISYDPADLPQTVKQLVDRAPLPDAVIMDRDYFALLVMEELQSHGVRIPGDIRIVGFDDLVAARTATPPLTSVRWDAVALGKRAMSLLLALIRREVLEDHVQLPYELVLRESCGCALPTASDGEPRHKAR
jgi:LacI family transcriptional regulator